MSHAPSTGALAATSSPATDLEAVGHPDRHEALRLWLRLLTCTLMVEDDIRGRLRRDFATTLPRFDLMAQLERHPDGLKMSELSKRMMVTGGNVTTITDSLERDGLVARIDDPNDRRTRCVVLTAAGKTQFAGMATEHERWVVHLFGDLDAVQCDALFQLLGNLKQSVRTRLAQSPMETP